jgi:hypothetical protein
MLMLDESKLSGKDEQKENRKNRWGVQAHHRAPHDRFWDSLSQKSIRHAANH